MSKTADFEALARELRSLCHAMGKKDSPEGALRSLLVMRRVDGVTSGEWQEFCRRFPLGQWCALPLPPAMESAAGLILADLYDDESGTQLPLLAPEVLSILLALLSRELLIRQLERELHRLDRNGGELTLVCGGVFGEKKGEERLPPAPSHVDGTVQTVDSSSMAGAFAEGERMLCEILRQRLENCDSLGALEGGQLLAILPGYGLLRGRMLAEKARAVFSQRRQNVANAPEGVLTTPYNSCAFGIVSVSRGDKTAPDVLLQRATEAFENARYEQDGIHYDHGAPLSERATLVHSQEKRFLFYGEEGD